MHRYARIPSNQLTSCDGCRESKTFDVNYALDCKKNGMIIARHDEIRDEIRCLLAHVFNAFRITCEPMINPAPMRGNDTETHVPSASSSYDYLNADRRNLLIRGFWEGLTDTFIDVRVTTLDSDLKELATQEGFGTTREREEEEEILQALREPTSPLHTFRGIDQRIVDYTLTVMLYTY